MSATRAALLLVGLVLVAACASPSGNKPVAATSAAPVLSTPTKAPSAASPTPSPAATPTPVFTSPMNPILVEFVDNRMVGGGTAVTLYRPDGTVVASHEGRVVYGEHAIGAYLVTANDGSGNEWTLDISGSIRPVAATAAKLLTDNAPGDLLVLDASTAIAGCNPAANGACTATEIDLASGTVRPLLNAATSLAVLDASYDRQTIWFREVIHASGASPTVNIAAVDLRTGKVARQALPVAMASEQNLAISRDGKWVAGQEDAGFDSNHVAIQHLHLVSMAAGTDTDIQGSAPYVSGTNRPSIQFAPDGASVLWWGNLNPSGLAIGVNVAAVKGVGKSISVDGNYVASGNLNAVFWLDGTRIVAQSLPPGYTVAVDKDSGAMELVNARVTPTTFNSVMYGSAAPTTS